MDVLTYHCWFAEGPAPLIGSGFPILFAERLVGVIVQWRALIL
jgi:hypothetical protein